MSGPRIATTAERPAPVPGGIPAGPIGVIARAEARREVAARGSAAAEEAQADLVPPVRELAPQGLAAIVDAAFGPVRLPGLMPLADALEAAAARMEMLASVDPALAEVAGAVVADERRKILRYLDLRDR